MAMHSPALVKWILVTIKSLTDTNNSSNTMLLFLF